MTAPSPSDPDRLAGLIERIVKLLIEAIRDPLDIAHAPGSLEARLRHLEDLPLCRRQLPDGTVPGGTEEALEAWVAVADHQAHQLDGLRGALAHVAEQRDEARSGKDVARLNSMLDVCNRDLDGHMRQAREHAKDIAVLKASEVAADAEIHRLRAELELFVRAGPAADAANERLWQNHDALKAANALLVGERDAARERWGTTCLVCTAAMGADLGGVCSKCCAELANAVQGVRDDAATAAFSAGQAGFVREGLGRELASLVTTTRIRAW